MKKGLCGYSDLLEILTSQRPDLVPVAIQLLALEYAEEKQQQSISPPIEPIVKKPNSNKYTDSETTDIQNLPLAEIPFWYQVDYRHFEQFDLENSEDTVQSTRVDWIKRPAHPPLFKPLALWNELLPRLKALDINKKPGKRIDLQKAVEFLSLGEFLYDLPKKYQQRWGASVQIIIDRSLHLTPYWDDQIIVCQQLEQLFPAPAIRRGVYYEGLELPLFFSDHPDQRQYRVPVSGSLVIVLGDLGLLSTTKANQQVWQGLGKLLTENNCKPLVLFPSQQAETYCKKLSFWNVINWETATQVNQKSRRPVAKQLQQILTLVSPSIRVEPGFLRSVRKLLNADASLESLFWQHSDVIGKAHAAATIEPNAAKQLRLDFEQEDADLQLAVISLLRHSRAELPMEIWFEELISLSPTIRALIKQLPDIQSDYRNATHYFVGLGQSHDDQKPVQEKLQSWFFRLEQRLPVYTWQDSKLKTNLNRLWQQCHRDDADAIETKPPPGYDPVDIEVDPNQPLKTWQLYQHSGQLSAVPASTDEDDLKQQQGSWIGQIRSRNGEISVATIDQQIQQQNEFWKSGLAPDWASDWGQDKFGLWVEFLLMDNNHSPIVQRMRWIEAGQFLMGSAIDEAERSIREGPQQLVILSRGFWLFDTVCNQVLWQAVMADNPSHFKGEDRPVENVSWQDCQQFLQTIKQQQPSLELTLPSEAQWEYACRAGTVTAFSFGQSINPDQANYDGNFPCADGEKGLFREETVEVKHFQPNTWGLYQMHGNVDEWCLDSMRDYGKSTVTDPLGSLEDGAVRVLRGGSWSGSARVVRSAFRIAYQPALRNYILGFRCARVHAGAEPVESLQDRPRQRRLAASQRQVTARITVDSPLTANNCAWPQAEQLVIRSDSEDLVVDTLTLPKWADAIGRDRFGLWTCFEISKNEDKVRQRLRWIPPGQFQMGSDLDEAGRYDNEGPLHPVILSQGYWIFDTPCTQALWLAVMGDNPSEFKSSQRPVESVSCEDVQAFIKQLNQRVPGLNLVLPTEAQWEYACRAGTDKATYAGDLEILGGYNAPILHKIAWYGGNSGVDFDLQKGVDSSGWDEKQFSHVKTSTRVVAGKQPNLWGLYDMLGNVWEWCQDGMRDYDEATITDPVGLLEDGALRVLRGGSWRSNAKYVRSAYRNADRPDGRSSLLGFRCARVHDPED